MTAPPHPTEPHPDASGGPAPGPVLLVEPYLGGSHRAWLDGVVAHSGHEIVVVSHPARFWTWRMRGSAVTLAEACRSLEQVPAAVVATDMVDLAAFRTFARDAIGDPPVGLYMHESQLTYPVSPRMEPDISFAFTNWTSTLAADVVWFNSPHHREVFFGELPRLLRRFPDHTHEHLIDEVRGRSEILEVGVDLSWVTRPSRARSGPIRLLWNHRWEHDKDPAAFCGAVDALAGEGQDFELVVCGGPFGSQDSDLDRMIRRHPERVVHAGHADLEHYRELLAASDVVVSTARQEFFGISVVEGAAAGCMPVVPDRLSYPDVVPTSFHEACLYPEGHLAEHLRWVVTHPEDVRRIGAAIAPEMGRWGWETMGPRYRTAFDRLLGVPS